MWSRLGSGERVLAPRSLRRNYVALERWGLLEINSDCAIYCFLCFSTTVWIGCVVALDLDVTRNTAQTADVPVEYERLNACAS